MNQNKNRDRPAWFFWLSFLMANAFIFLPKYILNIDSVNFLPLGDGFFERSNQDLFRLSGEFSLLCGLLFFLKDRKWFQSLLSLFFFQ